jgi:hypothetical protein
MTSKYIISGPVKSIRLKNSNPPSSQQQHQEGPTTQVPAPSAAAATAAVADVGGAGDDDRLICAICIEDAALQDRLQCLSNRRGI